MTVQFDHLDTAAIEDMLPHSGNMSLLSRVLEYTPDRIVSESTSHLDPANPLRSAGHLPVSVGIEYAAQTVALHAALTGKGSGEPRRGYLAVLSKITWHEDRLDDAKGSLEVEANLLVATENSSQFSFTVSADNRIFLDGSFVVSLEPVKT